MRAFAAVLALVAAPSLVLGSLVPRSLIDVCAHVEINLFAGLDLVDDILAILDLPVAVSGDIDVCLCLSALPVFLTADVTAAAAVKVKGQNVVSAFLSALINDISGGNKCYYPQNSGSVCTASTPCGWNCNSGYKKVGSQCIPILTAPGPSAPPRARSIAAPSCASAGERVCGTSNGMQQWECVNVMSELESCGGCAFPPPFPELASTTPLGTDCTAISNVADVRCSMGSCVVQKCEDGFVPSSDRTACVPTIRASHNKSGIKGGKHAHTHHVVSDILGQMASIVANS